MVKVHKRKKNSRIRGAKTCGWGFRQKHKGHGNKGGRGMSGAGKRADQKKQFAKNLDPNKRYFGKQGYTSRSTKIKKYEKINLSDIKSNFFKKEGERIDFSKHKILGTGIGFKAEIMARSATKSAIEKMEKAGGKITFISNKKEVSKQKEEKSSEVEKPKKETEKKKTAKKTAKKISKK